MSNRRIRKIQCQPEIIYRGHGENNMRQKPLVPKFWPKAPLRSAVLGVFRATIEIVLTQPTCMHK